MTRPRQPAPPCGTPRAYSRHVRYGEPIDEACRAAHRAYDAGYRERRRAQGGEAEPCGACGGPRDPIGGGYGWCAACLRAWQRAGRPAEGPPPRPAARRAEYAWLREQGVRIEEAAAAVGIALRTAAESWEPRRLITVKEIT